MTSVSVNASRWKRLAQNLALSLGVFLLCLIALEIILRLNGYGNLEIYEPNAALYWKLKPNQDCYTKVGHKPVHINSRGTRGAEFEIPKPPNTIRILSLGDSRTFGWGLSEEETYSGVLLALLQKQAHAGQKFEIINAGVNAWSYPQMLVYFRETGLQFQPDMVILGEANAWTQFSETNNPDFVKKFMTRVRMKNFLRRFAVYHYVVELKLKEFYERHRTKFIPVDPHQDALFKEQQQADAPAVFRRAIEELCRLAQDRGVKPIMVYLPAVDEAAATNPPAMFEIKQKLSENLAVPLVDMTPEARGRGKELYLPDDPVHFNAAGNAMIARRLFEIVTALHLDEENGHPRRILELSPRP